jgi:GntR family transcriptional repressor for pyruvate dehydrogenase complex
MLRAPGAVTFVPVGGRRVSAQIAEQLQRAIFSGALPEGDRLPSERELAERFSASRASVLEAVHILELTGLVEIRRGSAGGAFVTKPDAGKVGAMLQTMVRGNRFELDELFQARQLIEPGIAELAARTADAPAIDALRASIRASRARFERRDRSYPATENFHYLLARATGSDLLVMLVSSVLSAREARDLSRPPATDHRICAHEQVVAAIERGDGVAASTAMAEHVLHLRTEAMKGMQP